MTIGLRGLAAIICLVASSWSARALDIETLTIPMPAAGAAGLEAVLVEPEGVGRHPLAIVSHGSPRDGADRPGMSARGMLNQAYAFARKGFVAVSVLRRGYGASGGGWAEAYGPCDDPDYVKAGRAGAADLRAAIAFLSKRSDVDASRILAVGVSAGGFATVGLAADAPPGLIGAISFAGGRGSKGPDEVCGGARLVAAMGTFGATSRVPMLWIYARNDHFFGPDLARRMYEAFIRAGGHATLEMVPPYGDDGHHLFLAPDATAWTPLVDPFLDRLGLGGHDRSAATLPLPPQLRASARNDFQTYLNAAPHKAFAISEAGAYAWRTARETTADAREQALANCRKLAQAACRVYAVDDSLAR